MQGVEPWSGPPKSVNTAKAHPHTPTVPRRAYLRTAARLFIPLSLFHPLSLSLSLSLSDKILSGLSLGHFRLRRKEKKRLQRTVGVWWDMRPANMLNKNFRIFFSYNNPVCCSMIWLKTFSKYFMLKTGLKVSMFEVTTKMYSYL